jgi:hypothetical protein
MSIDGSHIIIIFYLLVGCGVISVALMLVGGLNGSPIRCASSAAAIESWGREPSARGLAVILAELFKVGE